MLPILPVEILSQIIFESAPDWEYDWLDDGWDGPFNEEYVEDENRPREVMLKDLRDFLSLRFVNKTFSQLVVGNLFTAVRDGYIGRSLPLYDDPPSPSILAMGCKLLEMLLERRSSDSSSAAYSVVKTMCQAVDEVVESFPMIGAKDPPSEAKRRREAMHKIPVQRVYTYGALAVVTGILRTDLILDVISETVKQETLEFKMPDVHGLKITAAAYLGELEHLKLLLNEPKSCRYPIDKYALALMAASYGGWVEEVEYVIECRQDANMILMPDRDTALHFAALGGRADVIQTLLRRGAIPNVINEHSETPLQLAAAGGHTDPVRALLANKTVKPQLASDAYCAPLIIAVTRGYLEVVKEFRRWKRVKLDAQATVMNSPNGTAVGVAAHRAHVEIFRLLFTSPEVDRGNELIFEASLHGGSVEIVRDVIKATPNALTIYEDANGMTALACAAKYGDEELVRYLLTVKPSDINEGAGRGWAPLHYAVEGKDIGTLKALLQHPHIDPNCAPDRYDPETPLHHVITTKNSRVEMVAALLAHPDLNPNALSEHRATPLILSVFHDRADIMKLLLAEPRVNKEATDRNGNTALLSAAYVCSTEMVQILLDTPGTNIWHCNKKAETALHIAVIAANIPIIQKLLSPRYKVTHEIMQSVIDHASRQANALIESPAFIRIPQSVRTAERIIEARDLIQRYRDRLREHGV
ncbi:ankyrin repeat domain-containing protein [Aspergillus stella-maris]|uniref:ankyrin repeat domain-containing protein n=1 Tax=Aspergillus stella-maris TaxID=1810926 RepID=UPI003CCE4F0B